MRWVRTFVLVLAFVLATLLGVLAFVDNSSVVALRFLDWHTPELSLYWWLLGSLVLGITIGWSVAAVTIVRAKVAERRVRRELVRTRDQTDAAAGGAPEPRQV